MKTKTYIHIQAPCSENWNGMQPEDRGRFCQRCASSVTDFSAMSDGEILKTLALGPASGCGRFMADQLDRQVRIPASAARKTFWAYLLSVCLPLLAAVKLNAQKSRNAPAQTEQKATAKPAKPVNEVSAVNREISDTIKINNQPPDTTGLRAELPMEPVVMGLIIQYEKVERTDTLAAWVDKTVKNEMFKIYPNPAVKGKKLAIAVKKAGEYSLELLDLDSKMILVQTARITAKDQIVFINLPSSLASGGYYLRMTNTATRKKFVDKLLVK